MFVCDAVSISTLIFLFFFFKQKTAYEMRISDWSSDVCSSDLTERHGACGERIDEAVNEGRAAARQRGDGIEQRFVRQPFRRAERGHQGRDRSPSGFVQPARIERDRRPDRKSPRLNSSH